MTREKKQVQAREQEAEAGGYSALPRPRRGNRRASGGSTFSGAEPRLAGLTGGSPQKETPAESERDRWLKEEVPPHYGKL